MATPKGEGEFHRKTAARTYNETWDFMERKDKNADDERQMLHLAHASRFHWSLVGSPRNLAAGDWQISRVYAALGEPDLALTFARSSLEICRKENLQDVLHTAYEAMARAYAVAKDYRSARTYVDKAREQLDASGADDEDMKIYLDQIRETERLIGRSHTAHDGA